MPNSGLADMVYLLLALGGTSHMVLVECFQCFVVVVVVYSFYLSFFFLFDWRKIKS